jgi:2-amino-4-hydroxy-6-hydroxymethyldihydropteridine diphosphokinase
MKSATVLVALGSNKPHGRFGAPRGVLVAAIAALQKHGLELVAQSRIRSTEPIGPSSRSYANAAVAVRTKLPLPALLGVLKRLEAQFGKRRGQRWGARTLDLDIIGAGAAVLPSGLRWRLAVRGKVPHGLIVPHPRLDGRRFVLDPLRDIAPDWRHPVLGLSVRQLHARAHRPKGCADG